jgi:hypothetical protein
MMISKILTYLVIVSACLMAFALTTQTLQRLDPQSRELLGIGTRHPVKISNERG